MTTIQEILETERRKAEQRYARITAIIETLAAENTDIPRWLESRRGEWARYDNALSIALRHIPALSLRWGDEEI